MNPTAYLVASGDLRLSANQTCWPAQEAMEKKIIAAFAAEGVEVIRAHPYDPMEKHGFISSQRMGMDVFQSIPVEAPVIVAEAVWQYSYHVLAGLRDQRGPIGHAGIAQPAGISTGLIHQNVDPPYQFPNMRAVIHWIRDTPLRTSNLRAPGKVAIESEFEWPHEIIAGKGGLTGHRSRARNEEMRIWLASQHAGE